VNSTPRILIHWIIRMTLTVRSAPGRANLSHPLTDEGRTKPTLMLSNSSTA